MDNALLQKPYQKLNANALKLIAIVAMTIDHLAWFFFPGYPAELLPLAMHAIGRLTCPIMCFFIAEGYHYTHDVKKYSRRLLVFAALSHVPYMMQSMAFREYGWLSLIPFATGQGFGHFLNQTSVIWPYFIGLTMLRLNDTNWKPWKKTVLFVLLCVAAFPSDWSCIASLVIFAVGTNRGNPKAQILSSFAFYAMYALVYCFALDTVYGLLQMCVVLALPVLLLYNGTRGKNPKVNRVMKWLFYAYYPLHLAILGVLQLLLH